MIYCPRYGKTITSDWHTPITPCNIRTSSCKHLRLFRGVGATGFDTYIFFPGLPVKRSKRNSANAIRRRCFPSIEEQRFFIDSILFPALRAVYPPRILIHHPRSFNEAYDRSYSRRKENITSGDRSFSELSYDLPAYLSSNDTLPLGRLWKAILQRSATAEDARWSRIELVTVSYGCKNLFYSQTFHQLRTLTLEQLHHRFDLSYANLPYAFVDLAFEDSATRPSNQGVPDNEATSKVEGDNLFVVH